MILSIDTTNNDFIELILLNKNSVIDKMMIKTEYNQSELLLLSIEKLLKKNKKELEDVKSIIVNNKGGSFTSLRIGIATANALSYALDVPIKNKEGEGSKRSGIQIVAPKYDREPNITKKKK